MKNNISNTTLVKVILIGIFPTYGVIFNSNTTLVKVKLMYLACGILTIT